jgi:hypothetical protein
MPSASSSSSSAVLAIFWGGLACGVFDITQAMVAFYLQSGLRPAQVFNRRTLDSVVLENKCIIDLWPNPVHPYILPDYC